MNAFPFNPEPDHHRDYDHDPRPADGSLPRDPGLDPLLTQVLGRPGPGEGMDPDLPTRIVAATAHRLPRPVDRTPAPTPGVAHPPRPMAIARLGGGGATWRFAAAATILLGTAVGWWVLGDGPASSHVNPSTPGPVADAGGGVAPPAPGTVADSAAAEVPGAGAAVPAVEGIAALEAELVRLGDQPLASPSPDVLDDQLDLLAMQLSFAGSDGVWADDAIVSLDKAMARDEFDTLSQQMDLMF